MGSALLALRTCDRARGIRASWEHAMANMQVRPGLVKRSTGRSGTEKETSRIGHFDQLESRELLSAFHPIETRFEWSAKRTPTTSVRFDADGNFLGATGPEAGLHPGGLLGGSTHDPSQITLRFSG